MDSVSKRICFPTLVRVSIKGINQQLKVSIKVVLLSQKSSVVGRHGRVNLIIFYLFSKSLELSDYLCLPACSISKMQISDVTKLGLMINKKVLTASMPRYTSANQSAVDRISCQSAQGSRSRGGDQIDDKQSRCHGENRRIRPDIANGL